jgi:hypothetical protein
VAAQVAGVLAATPGAVEVRVKSQPGAPVLGSRSIRRAWRCTG